MTRGRAGPWALFALTLWPVIALALAIDLLPRVFAAFVLEGDVATQEALLPTAVAIVLGSIPTLLLIVGLTVYYTRRLTRTDDVPRDQRAAWGVAFVVGAFLVFPVYWWIYLRPGRPAGRGPLGGPGADGGR